MIRNVVIHISGEQPLLADIFEVPTASDACLVCTNLRTMDGKKPIFIDRTEATFLFPLIHVRFVEIPPDALPGGEGSMLPAEMGTRSGGGGAPQAEAELDLDEDFLRRIREI